MCGIEAFCAPRLQGGIPYGSRLDQNRPGAAPGGKDGNQQQGRRNVPEHSLGDRREGDQEKRRLRSSRTWPAEKVRPQGARRPQSPDRRTPQDPGQDRGEVLRRQGGQRRNRSSEKVACGLNVPIHTEGQPTGWPFFVDVSAFLARPRAAEVGMEKARLFELLFREVHCLSNSRPAIQACNSSQPHSHNTTSFTARAFTALRTHSTTMVMPRLPRPKSRSLRIALLRLTSSQVAVLDWRKSSPGMKAAIRPLRCRTSSAFHTCSRKSPPTP